MTDEQIPKTEENTETGRKKFTLRLNLYFVAMSCLIWIALIYFIKQASSGRLDTNNLIESDIGRSAKQALSSSAQSTGVICQLKTNDEGAMHLLRYVIENPPKASEREHMAKNIQESGIDLYTQNLQYLESEGRNELLMKDSQTLKEYSTLNVQLFSLLKSAVLEGRDPGTLKDLDLYEQVYDMQERVHQIYNSY
ncbi:MAG: hypothetical protein ACM3QX_12315 [Syntrophomonadaceae bacterium]